MKKIISMLLALSMLMTVSIVVKAETQKIDAYSAKIAASESSGIYKSNGTLGELTSNGKYAFSNGNAAAVMFKNIDFGANGVEKLIVDLGGDRNDLNTSIKFYTYKSGEAPFVDYSTNTLKAEYSISTTGAILKSGTAIERSNELKIDGSTVKFLGWSEGTNNFEIPITGGTKMTGEYDIFVGTSYGTLHGISFVEYDKKATNYFAWDGYSHLSKPAVLVDGKQFLQVSNNASLIVYRDVDFGNVGIKSLNVDIAPGRVVGSGNSTGVSLYLLKKGEVYDENWNLKDGYVEVNQQLHKDGKAITPVNYGLFQAESGTEWQKHTYTIDIPNGFRYRGKYDVVIGMGYGNFHGMTFEMLDHEPVSAYTKLNAEDAINLGDSSFNASVGCYAMSSGSQKMVLYKNVNFGEKGASKIILDAKLFTDDAKNMRIYLVRPEDDKYIDEMGRLNGYTLSSNQFMKNGASVPATISTTFSTGNGIQKEVEIDITNDNCTEGDRITGVYNVYVGLATGNFYGIQFVEATDEETEETERVYLELSAPEAINFCGASYNESKELYSMSSGNKIVLFKNVDFGKLGTEKVKLFASNSAGTYSAMHMYLVRPDDDQFVDENGNLSDKYEVSGHRFKDKESGITIDGTVRHGFYAENGWTKEEFVFDFADSYYTGDPVTGVYNVYVGLSTGNFYGLQFVERVPVNKPEAKCEDASMSLDGKNVNVTFTYDFEIDPADVNKDSIICSVGNDTLTDYTVEYDSESKRAFTVVFKNHSIKDDYVRVATVSNGLGRFSAMFKAPTAVKLDDLSITPTNTAGKVDIRANIYTNTANSVKEGTKCFIALKDSAGMLVDIAVVPVNGNGVIPVECQLKKYSDECVLEAFLFEEDLMPVINKISYKKTYGLDKVKDPTEDITVVAIGGSNTEGGKYTTPFIESWQKDREGKITFYNSGIGGTNSEYGAIRFAEDALVYKPDVVIVEFIGNDTTIQDSCKKYVESFIRQAQAAEHEPVLLFVYRPERRLYADGVTSWIDRNIETYDEVLAYYGITPINAHSLVIESINKSEDDDITWDTYVSEGNVHFDTEQGKAISDLMYNKFTTDSDLYLKKPQRKADLINDGYIVHHNSYNVSSVYAKYDEKWIDTDISNDDIVTEGYQQPTSKRFDKYIQTVKMDAKMSFEFKGSKLVITGYMNEHGGSANYMIFSKNGVLEKSGTISSYYANKGLMETTLLRIDDLSDDAHTIIINTIEDGKSFGIGEFWVDE